MSHNIKVDIVVIPGYVHQIESVQIQPETNLSHWQLIKVRDKDGHFSRHLAGRADGEGRASTDIVALDIVRLRATTRSGRIYVLQRQLNPDSWTYNHCGSAICDFNALFSNIMLTGEHYREKCLKYRYYLEFMTLEEFRIQNCTEFGPLRTFLPQFSGGKTEASDVADHTMGMVMLHNLNLHPSLIAKDVVDACRNRYYSFYDSGKNNRFIPYWKPGAADSGNPAVPCSAFVNDSGTLLVYLNTTNQPQEFSLQTDSRNGALVYDPLIKQTDSAKPRQKIKLEPYMMKMALFGPPDIWKTIR
jgi:hypothetical protein